MYIAMDMGTSNTRLWLCEGESVLCSRKGTFGAGDGAAHGKEYLYGKLAELIDALLVENGHTPEEIECVLVCGMAGSEAGLTEIPHIVMPADPGDLAAGLQMRSLPSIAPFPFLFVPGLVKKRAGRVVDMMRGEETESIGLIGIRPEGEDSVFVLPGTHNKVVRVSGTGEIGDCYTTLSGELLNGIMEHTILRGQLSHQFELCQAQVLRGAEYARQNGLNAALFHIRVMGRNGCDGDALSSFLYGCVLGQDVDVITRMAQGGPIYVGGRENLRRAYCTLLGENAVEIEEQAAQYATCCGLQAIYRLQRAYSQRPAVLERIEEEKLIAIIRAPREDSLLPAAQALYRGGVRLAEITFDRSGRIPKKQTAHFIRTLRENMPMLVGAGTVTSTEEVRLAAEAGASFIISPNCDPEVIGLTRKLGLVSIPAAFTPTEIAAALRNGADFIKLFPADQLKDGYVRAVKAPLSDARLLAVGGVTAENAAEWLRRGFCGIGVGSGLYDPKLIAAEDWPALEKLARQFVSTLKN